MKNKYFLISATLLVVVATFLVGSYIYKKSEREKLETMAQQRSQLFVRSHSPTLGPAMAKVTLVEFLDPECEACRAFYPAVKALMQEFDGKLRLVVRYAPFHQNSKMVVKILEAAREQGKYWETLELIFENQPEWGNHHNPNPDLLWTYLPELDLDVEQIRKDMQDPKIEKILEQDIDDGQKLGVRKTPGFFVNGKPLESFGFEQLRDLIKSEM